MSELETETGEEPATSSTDIAPPQGGVSVSGGEQSPNGNGTLASGEEAPKEEVKSYWPEDWRHKVAEHAAAGNEKVYKKELQRLEKLASTPADLYNAYRAIESTWSSRNFVKLPGKNATPEELAEYNKAMGVPDTPQDYLKNLEFDDGLVLGDWDKPAVDGFTQRMHAVGAPPAVVKEALHWYLKSQEEDAAALDEADDSFRRVSDQALKNEYGNAYKRYINNIATLFQNAPGGADLDNEEGVYSRVLGGRTADGKKIGNDPDVIRWLASVANNLNPAGTVVEDADASGKSIDTEIAQIEQIMRTDRRTYDKQYATRYGELLTAREKIRAKAR
jgi:hypothetical protein